MRSPTRQLDTRPPASTVLPSLWDRMINEVPGIIAEIDRTRAPIDAELGPERVDELIAGGVRAIGQQAELSDETARSLIELIGLVERRRLLEVATEDSSRADLREIIRRDLEALFNVERLESVPLFTDKEAAEDDSTVDLSDYPNIRTSVLSFGVPSFAGRSADDLDTDRISRELVQIVEHFEPRLRPGSVKVTIEKRPVFTIQVDGIIRASPDVERLSLRTTVDLDDGRASTALGAD